MSALATANDPQALGLNPETALPDPATCFAEAALAERWEQLRTSNAEIDVLVRVEPDDDWTIVNWRLSRHNGRWLTDALSIT